ncbi:hypothetical protein Chor_012109 [Crotalus horridus]
MPVSCRHAAIANYFGDDVPQCNRSCDYCKNPAAVKKQVEALQHSTKSWSRTYIGPSASSWNACDPELYGGGKRGCGGFERYDEDTRNVGEVNEDSQKKAWNIFYNKQMKLRRVLYLLLLIDSDCPLKDAANRKIARITVKAREHCLWMLEEALVTNRQAAPMTDSVDCTVTPLIRKHRACPLYLEKCLQPLLLKLWVCFSSGLLACAVEMEYEAFRINKMANLYKASVLKKVTEINKASKNGELYATPDLGISDNPKMKGEPTATHDDVFCQASKVNTFKPKRMGIGFRRMSDMFQSASEVLSAKEGDEVNVVKEEIGSDWKEDGGCGPKPLDMGDILEDKEEATNKICKNGGESPEKNTENDTAEAATSLAVSLEKRKTTKKQLLLAEAARKESQNISKFFSIPKAGCKAKASEIDLAEEKINCLNELPQFTSRRACEEKAEPKETATVFKEELTSSPPKKEQESQNIENLSLSSQRLGREFSCSGSSLEKPTSIFNLQYKSNDFLAFKGGKEQNDLESPAEKRLRMMNKSSILSQSEGKAVGLAKKKVTFDPNLSQVDKEGTTRVIQPPSKTLSLKETADIVVKYLTPFYKSGRFASKDLFKGFARHLSHLLAADKSSFRKTVKEEAQRLIKSFFKRRDKCENETDWQELTPLET